jgi:hypothetical protein
MHIKIDHTGMLEAICKTLYPPGGFTAITTEQAYALVRGDRVPIDHGTERELVAAVLIAAIPHAPAQATKIELDRLAGILTNNYADQRDRTGEGWAIEDEHRIAPPLIMRKTSAPAELSPGPTDAKGMPV